MIVDDRLDTVLRTVAAGPTAARTQFLQLVDLLRRDDARGAKQHDSALERLDSLTTLLGEDERAALLRQTRLTNAALVARFAAQEPRVALAAIGSARLPEQGWLDLIPALPVRARGFLRHRRDLGANVEALLARLGIDDFGLPLPDGYHALPATPAQTGESGAWPIDEAADGRIAVLTPATRTPPPSPETDGQPGRNEGIGAIVRRIEAFRRNRDAAAAPADPTAPHLPFSDEARATAPPRITAIDARCDASGGIVQAGVQAGAGFGPMLVGFRPFTTEPGAPARCDAATVRAAERHVPIIAGRMELTGSPLIAGAWRIDATPLFSADGGRFTGYHALLRRPAAPHVAGAETASGRPANDDVPDGSADRLRQVLHELRTPINAIQGFAELIQQQLFGETPHQYRGLAASIAADAARMLAGFEEIERLVKLESGRLESEPGETDLAELVGRLLKQLEPATVSRQVRLSFTRPEAPVPVGVARIELERMIWRVFSVMAASAAPGERLATALSEDNGTAVLALPLTASLALHDDETLFAPDQGRGGVQPVSAMLGHGFALRLAMAEARAAGGRLERRGSKIIVTLPILTRPDHALSESEGPAAGAG